MPLPELSDDALGAHAARLYSAAQTLTLDATAAAELVELVYRRAYAVPAVERPADPRPWLYGLLLEAHAERTPPLPDVGAEPAPAPTPPRSGGDLRRRLALDVAQRTLPSVLVGLPERHRLLLLLSYVDHLSPADVGRVLDMDSDDVLRQRDEARVRLEAGVRHHASPADRTLLDESLPPDWIEVALRHASDALLTPLPPTLGQSIADAAPSAAPAPAARPRRGLWARLRRPLVGATLIVAAGLLGVALSEVLRPAPEDDLVALTARDAEAAQVSLETDDAREAERFAAERAGFSFRAPSIDGATLTGVGFSTPAPGVQVPVLRYLDADGFITVYAYTYALLDLVEEQARLAPDVLNQIAEDQHFDLYDEGAAKVLIWRDRDDIFLAVTRGDAEALSERIVPAS